MSSTSWTTTFWPRGLTTSDPPKSWPGLRGPRLSRASIGYSYPGGRHPGTYYDPILLSAEEGLLTWAVAHEVAHQAEHALSRRRAYPSWFDEGVADYVAGEVVRESHPDFYAQREFVASAVLGAAAQRGMTPQLTGIISNRQWVPAADQDPDLLYSAARLAVRQLVTRRGFNAITRTLVAVGNVPTIPFVRAFPEHFGQPVAQVDADLSELASSMASRFPPGISAAAQTVPANKLMQFVFVGLDPGDLVVWSLTGPGECGSVTPAQANSVGVSALAFQVERESQSACVGPWIVNAYSEGGAEGSFTFLLAAP